jgi:hypothetical protein
MGELTGPEIISRFEEVLTNNLGDVGKFLLEQQLNECGKTRETFTKHDVNPLIERMKKEFSKVIGYGVEKLEIDLRRSIRGEVDV